MQGIIAVLLSLKKKPVIRYERMSSMAKKLGMEVQVCRFTKLKDQADLLGSIAYKRKHHFSILGHRRVFLFS